MGLRSFRSGDGQCWRVWLAQSGSLARLPGTPAEWLCFQNDANSERRRLIDFPPKWDELPEDRLDLLRQQATAVTLVTRRHSPPEGAKALPTGKTGKSEEDVRGYLAGLSPQGRIFTAEEVAEVICALLTDGFRGVNGQAVNLDGGEIQE